MIKRNLDDICFSRNFGSQMRFVAGPRQSGKTTLAIKFLKENHLDKLYFNWDYRETRIAFQKDPEFYEQALLDIQPTKTPWICFDEIHKYPKWKNILKEVYDKHGRKYRFIITGSAKLDLFRKSGDSLAGRYFLFRLFPLVLNEITGRNKPRSDLLNGPEDFINNRLSRVEYRQEGMEGLLKFSGFPDPFLAQNESFHNKWRNAYVDRLIREDLREMSQVADLENVSRLMLLLPEKAASPLSVNSLRNDMLVSYNALKNYLFLLELAYISFPVEPYSRNIARSIRKEKKVYFFDWTHITDIAKRFENYVSVELKALIEIWNDLGNDFELFYLKTKDGKESDFLLLRNKKPWLIIEVKLTGQKIERHHLNSAKKLGNIPVLQLVRENNITEKHGQSYQISASRFF